ncbi:MAG: DHH family phosphoesterase [Clostridia bacterium]|nr:DHH family phosphoesterase [Clostridia bacterium]
MKFKGFRYDTLLIAVSLAVAVVFTTLTVRDNKQLALYECIAIIAIFIFALVRILMSRRRYIRFLRKSAESLDITNRNVLSELDYPVAVCSEDGTIVWCNGIFIDDIAGGELTETVSVDAFFEKFDEENGGTVVRCAGKYYIEYERRFTQDGSSFRVLTFFDITDLKEIEDEYNATRPYGILIEIDNIGEARSGYRDSERTEIKGHIETMIDEWCDKFGSAVKGIGDERYVVYTEKRNIDLMIADKFSILDKVRKYEYRNKNAGLTLSMGIASGNDLRACEKESRKTLEIALGRGGDQAAVKTDDSYEFFGGVSKSAEKKYRSRIRVWGRKLASDISESGNVIICGHKNSDFDAVGAAAGVAYIARCLNVETHIAVDRSTSLAGKLIDELGNEYKNLFIDEDEAFGRINRRTLLVIVDTHNPSFIEYPDLFYKTEKRIIIDHHRLAPGIDTAIAYFMHNSGASSTCEMITEIIQYAVPDSPVPVNTAEALMSGLMLDTKNFSVRTGVRTFEAAAYLKDRGADTINVRKLFADTLEVAKAKNSVLLRAEKTYNIAISRLEEEYEDSRLIAAQAADELLNVEGVSASFIIFAENNKICVSARSMGEINVQLIMEEMGGGGHQTMAACQIENSDMDTVEKTIIEISETISEKEN